MSKIDLWNYGDEYELLLDPDSGGYFLCADVDVILIMNGPLKGWWVNEGDHVRKEHISNSNLLRIKEKVMDILPTLDAELRLIPKWVIDNQNLISTCYNRSKGPCNGGDECLEDNL